MRSGLLRGFSIEFDAGADQWAGELRTVTAAALPSIGVVDKPAYMSAEGIEVRRLGGVIDGENVSHVPSRPRRRMLWQLL